MDEAVARSEFVGALMSRQSFRLSPIPGVLYSRIVSLGKVYIGNNRRLKVSCIALDRFQINSDNKIAGFTAFCLAT
jgi:hypothetical protein